MKNSKIYYCINIILFGVTFFLFAPLEIYLTNISEFWFSIRLLLAYACTVTATVLVSGLIFYFVVDKISIKLAHYLCVIAFVISILGYFQGNYIVSHTGSLDGRTVDWSAINSDRILSIILWVMGTAIFVVFFRRIKSDKLIKKIGVISCLVVLLEVITIGSLLVMNMSSLFQKSSYCSTSKDEFLMSNEENFIILVLDSFDSGRMNQLLEEDYDKYGEILKDFTYYPNTLGNYGHTDLALPNLITGGLYYNDMIYDDYLKESYDSSAILNRLMRERWNIGIYTEAILPSCEIVDGMVNTVNDEKVSISSKKRFLTQIYRLVAYKYLPYELKKIAWFYPDFDSLRDVEDMDIEGYNGSVVRFNSILDTLSPQLNEKVYKVYHLDGTHWPWYVTDNLEESSEATDEMAVVYANLKLIDNYLDELRNNNIYDCSTIVILADHGFSSNGDDMSGLNQNPLLLIKGRNENHSLVVSDKAISYSNLQNIYKNLLDGYIGEAVVADINNKSRIFYKYDWDFRKKKDMYFPEIVEYSTTGIASDMNALTKTGNVYIAEE